MAGIEGPHTKETSKDTAHSISEKQITVGGLGCILTRGTCDICSKGSIRSCSLAGDQMIAPSKERKVAVTRNCHKV